MTRTTTKFLLATLTLFFSTALAFAQVEPNAASRAAWRQFQAQHGPDWRVTWHERSRTPRVVFAGQTQPFSGPPAQAARAFLKANRPLFAMKANLHDLELAGVRRLREVEHVRFRQTYEGLPVYDAEYLVHLHAGSGRVTMVNGTYYPDIDVVTTPRLDASAAEQVARQDLGATAQGDEQTQSELVIYPTEKAFHLAWKLEVPLASFGAWLYFVDAHDGTILYKRDQVMDVVGTGKVYLTHPGLSAVSTRDLYRLDGSGYLRGTYANVVNDEAGRAYSSNHSFQYGTSSTHFDEANLYYHIDRFRNDFIGGLADASNSLGFTQITAHAHSTCRGSDRNACFNRATGRLYFGDASSSSSINSFAREDKVIYHEYAHAIIYDQNSGIESTCTQEGAISEGVPDYFAGAYSGRTPIGDYVLGASHPSVRDMASPDFSSLTDYDAANGTYSQQVCPFGGVAPHDGGEFFSAVLWDLRGEPNLSGSQADWLVYAALSYVSADPTFAEFRSALLAEDQAEYGGAHACEIESTFYERGIGPSGLRASLSGDTYLNRGEQGSWTATASCPPAGSVSYEWAYRTSSSDPWTVLFGAGSSQLSHSFCESVTLRVAATSDGQTATDDINVYVSGTGSCDGGGGFPGGFAQAAPVLPEDYAVESAYPNPFIERTTLRLALPEAAAVTLTVYDALGREVARPVDGRLAAGWHDVVFEGRELPAGVYLYRLRAGAFTETGRVVRAR